VSVEEQRRMRHRDGLWARTANLLLSGWLIVSAFAWDGAGPPRIDAALVGYLVFVCTIVATVVDGARVLNTLLSLWLVLSVWLFPATHPAMRLNTLLVGSAMFLFSLVSTRGRVGPPEGLGARLRARAP